MRSTIFQPAVVLFGITGVSGGMAVALTRGRGDFVSTVVPLAVMATVFIVTAGILFIVADLEV
jgi:hypothetical protein